jgi:hypothetical protein
MTRALRRGQRRRPAESSLRRGSGVRGAPLVAACVRPISGARRLAPPPPRARVRRSAARLPVELGSAVGGRKVPTGEKWPPRGVAGYVGASSTPRYPAIRCDRLDPARRPHRSSVSCDLPTCSYPRGTALSVCRNQFLDFSKNYLTLISNSINKSIFYIRILANKKASERGSSADRPDPGRQISRPDGPGRVINNHFAKRPLHLAKIVLVVHRFLHTNT